MIRVRFFNIRDIALNEIHNSKRTISIAVAWFTQRDSFNAIIGAIERGINYVLLIVFSDSLLLQIKACQNNCFSRLFIQH